MTRMDEEEIIKLSDKEIEKIERVNKAICERYEAEASLESQKKYRILFERASVEALPFIIYVIYMGAVALVVLFKLLDLSGENLWIGAILLLVIVIAPLFILPVANWKGFLRYLKGKLTGQTNESSTQQGLYG